MNTHATLYQQPIPAGVEQRLRATFSSFSHIPVFFRADDIGSDQDPNFAPLMELFQKHHAPLCLAVVPTWLKPKTWESYASFQPASSQWCWHQHGYSHTNHQSKGKKAEFGDERTPQSITSDISKGQQLLRTVLGPSFTPVFTPPWNRCSPATLESLSAYGFKAISRSSGATPDPGDGLPDIFINIDLHTRKEATPAQAWENLLTEIEQAAISGRMGVMIHHQIMNHHAFVFLDLLLALFREYKLPQLTFTDILQC